jgi:hypothetical protein
MPECGGGSGKTHNAGRGEDAARKRRDAEDVEDGGRHASGCDLSGLSRTRDFIGCEREPAEALKGVGFALVGQ